MNIFRTQSIFGSEISLNAEQVLSDSNLFENRRRSVSEIYLFILQYLELLRLEYKVIVKCCIKLNVVLSIIRIIICNNLWPNETNPKYIFERGPSSVDKHI